MVNRHTLFSLAALLALLVLLIGCGPRLTPEGKHPLPSYCRTIPNGVSARVTILDQRSLDAMCPPGSLGCWHPPASIYVLPPAGNRDTRWVDLMIHEYCHVTHGAWHP